ncbi:hypothetical protein A4X09_0g4614 [Tilletia walkeri]|uniref:Uncharacterized protein n=1 Tax=Tilletia walkeri TaxID=117179 RepID=A0A8X7N8H0_9BASI|nr:hypothetical protein A4X09_0g4614 [Tilletia walkeri]
MKRSYPFNNTQAGSPNLPKKAGGAPGPNSGVTAGPALNAYANYGYGGNAAAAAQGAIAPAHSQPAQPPPPPPSISHDQQQAQWHQQWQQYYAQQAAASAPAPQMQGGHYHQPHAYQQPTQPPTQQYAQPPPPPAQQYQHQPYYSQPGPQYSAPPQHMPAPYPQHAYAGGPPGPMGAGPSGPIPNIGMNPTGMRLGPTTTHGPAPSLGPQQPQSMPTGPQGSNGGPNFHGRPQLPAAPGTYTPMGSGSGFAAPMAGPQPPMGGGGANHQSHHNGGQRSAKRPRFEGPNSGAAPTHSSLPAPPTGPSGVVRPQTGHVGGGMRKPGGPSQFNSPASNRGPGSMSGTPSGPRTGGFTTPSPRGPGGPGGRDFGGGQGMGRAPSGPRGAGSTSGPSHFRNASIAGSEDSRYGRDGRDRDRERDRDRFGPGGRSDRDRDAGGRDRGSRQGAGFQARGGGPGGGAGTPGGRGPSGPGSSYSSGTPSQPRGARQRSPVQHRHLTRDFRGQAKGGSAPGASGRDSFSGPGRNSQGSQSAAFAGRTGGGSSGGGGGPGSASGGLATLPAKVVATSGLGPAVPTGPKGKSESSRRGTTDFRMVGMTFGGVVAWEWTLDDGATLLAKDGEALETNKAEAHQGDGGSARGSDDDDSGSDRSEDDHEEEEDEEEDRDVLDEDRDSHDDSDGERTEQDAALKVADPTTSKADDQISAKPVDQEAAIKEATTGADSLSDAPVQGTVAETDAAVAEKPATSEAIESTQPTKGGKAVPEVVGEAATSQAAAKAEVSKEVPKGPKSSRQNGDENGKGKGKARREGKGFTGWNHPETCRLRLCFGMVTTPPVVEPIPEVVAVSKEGASGEEKSGDVDSEGVNTEPATKTQVAEAVTGEREKDAIPTEASDMNEDPAEAVDEAADQSVDVALTNGAKEEGHSESGPEPAVRGPSQQASGSAELLDSDAPGPVDSWTPFSKAPPQPANNRITLIYAQAQKRIHIDADVIYAVRIFRDERRVEIDVDTRSAALVRRAEAQRPKDAKNAAKLQDWMVSKGILLEARDDEQRNYVPVSLSNLRLAHGAALDDVKMGEGYAQTDAKDSDPQDVETTEATKVAAESETQKLALNSLPPLFRLRDADGETGATTTIVVQLDRAFQVRQAEWLRTGDIEDFLSTFEAPPSSTGGELIANPWRSKIYVVDPDPEPTIDDFLQLWVQKSYAGNGRERRRFLREYFETASNSAVTKNEDGTESNAVNGGDTNSAWALGQIFGRLGQGKPERYIMPTTAAAKLRSASTLGPNPLSVAATTELFGPGHSQSMAGLCSIALFDFIQELAPTAGWSDAEVRARLGHILVGMPQHTLFRALDSLFKDFSDATREREREATRSKAREERERAKAQEHKEKVSAKVASATEDETAVAANGDEDKREDNLEQTGETGAEDQASALDVGEGHENEVSEVEGLVLQLTEAEDAVVAQMIDDVAMQIAAEAAL